MTFTIAAAGEQINVWEIEDSVLASCGDDSTICLSGVQDGKTILRLNGNGQGTASAVASPPTIVGPSDRVSSIGFSAGSRYLVAGSGIQLHVYDLKHADRMARLLSGHVAEVNALDFGPQDATVASASAAGDILVHALASTSLQVKLASDGMPLEDLQHSPHRPGILAAVGGAGTVQVWDITASSLVAALKPGLTSSSMLGGTSIGMSGLSAMRFSTTSSNLLAAVGGKKLAFFDVSSKKCIRDIMTDYTCTSIDYHSDGCSLGIGTSQGHILMYDIRAASKPTMKILGASMTPIQAVKFQHTIASSTTTKKTIPTPAAPSAGRTPTSTSQPSQSQPQRQNQTLPLPAQPIANHNHSLNTTNSIASAPTIVPTASSNGGGAGDMFSPVKPASVIGNIHPSSNFPSFTSPISTHGSSSFTSDPSLLLSPIDSGSMRTSSAVSSHFPPSSSSAQPSSSSIRTTMPPSHLTSTFGSTRHTMNGPAAAAAAASNVHNPPFIPSTQPILTPTADVDYASPKRASPTQSASPPSTQRSPPASSTSQQQQQLVPSPHRTPTRVAGSPHAASSSFSSGGGASASAPFTSGPSASGLNDYQVSLLKSMLDESLYSLRHEFRTQLNDLHLQMLKQFHLQQQEQQRTMDALVTKFETMVQEVKDLREDYQQLKHIY